MADRMLYHVAAPDLPSIFYVMAIIRFSENPQSLIQFEQVHLLILFLWKKEEVR